MSATFQTSYWDVVVMHGIFSHREPVTVHIWSASSASVGVLAFTKLKFSVLYKQRWQAWIVC